MWAEIIKKRSGYKSEISGKAGKQVGGESILNAHHIVGKKTLALRYCLENGICLTQGEHHFQAHNESRRGDFEERVKELRGSNIYIKLRNNYKTSNKIIYYYMWLKQLSGE